MLRIGPYELYSVVNGTLRLDGGAMFGVVPKVLWEKVVDVDDQNRILLATRTLLAIDRSQPRVILVDTGCGSKWAVEAAQRFAIRYDPNAIGNALKSVGMSTDDVTDVVISHLHFDHNGGLTKWYDEPGEQVELCYPRARHWVHKEHWKHANDPSLKERASFLKEDFVALADRGVLSFVTGDDPPPPFNGVEWFVSHGHTTCQLHPVFNAGGKRLVFVGDLVPTAAHLRLGWVMAYDAQPLRTIQERELLYREAIEEGLLLAFPHDPDVGGVAIGGTVQRPIITHEVPLSLAQQAHTPTAEKRPLTR